jgi:diadenosine tetraphosphate (Ap4A) HIT family hydrolase
MTKEKDEGGTMLGPEWSLHPQLAADATLVGDLALSRLLAINAADYPWLVLVPRRRGAAELADLGSDAFPLMAEIGLVTLALKDLTGCDTINVAAIGNAVPQLHIHIVGRRQSDPLWPKPIFGDAPLRRAADAEFARFVAKVKKKVAAADVA